MTTGMMKWATGVVIGLSLFTAGCGEKKSAGDTSQSQVGAAPSSPPEKSVTDDTLQPSSGSEQRPSGANNKEQNTGDKRKSQRG